MIDNFGCISAILLHFKANSVIFLCVIFIGRYDRLELLHALRGITGLYAALYLRGRQKYFKMLYVYVLVAKASLKHII